MKRERNGFSSWWGALLIAAAGLLAYANSFTGPFLLDDTDNITDNATIRSLWPIGPVLTMPGQANTVAGRPLQNLSLALNYALCGLDARGYHAVNLLIHLANALLLYGLLRRALRLPSVAATLQRRAGGVALTVALLWVVHPLNTQAVTYITQRGESQASLFYLLTLYGLLRGAARSLRSTGGSVGAPLAETCCAKEVRASAAPTGGAKPRPPTAAAPWYALAVAACLLGVGCKEIVATAPLVALAFDRLFLAPSWRELFRRRWPLYVGLAASWLVLAFLKSTQHSDLTVAAAAMDTSRPLMALEHLRPKALADVNVTPWHYLLTQAGVIPHYLRLALWPDALCFDYGWPFARALRDVWRGAMIVGLLLAGVAWALVRVPRWGFLGLCFFLILAPTSSILPLGDAAWDYRMYLPLAAVLTAVVTAVLWVAAATHPPLRGPLRRRGSGSVASMTCDPLQGGVREAGGGWGQARGLRYALPALTAVAVFALAARTVDRNRDYRSALAIWEDTVRQRPANARAYHARGMAYADLGQFDAAEADLTTARQLAPESGEVLASLGEVLVRQGKLTDAEAVFAAACRLRPAPVHAQVGMANVLLLQGRNAEAMPYLHAALQVLPMSAEANSNLGIALCAQGRLEEGVRYLNRATELNPQSAESQNNLGRALMLLGRWAEAEEHLRLAVRLKPDYAEAQRNLDEVRRRQGAIQSIGASPLQE
ncbi:MAG: tetratricopeptide repeat protein [Lentisphaerae bacterium]|nr:tetratricopeptide repeat protein [Lentisphaerota bacterium]